jgi:hypothetical protein
MFSRRSVFEVLVLLLLLGSPALSFSAAAQNNPSGSSGYYESLLIGVDEKSGGVTGYFEDGTGWDERTKAPLFLCSFFLYGKLQGDAYQITTWYPDSILEPIKGRLKFTNAGGVSKARVKLEELPGGCGMTDPDLARGDGEEMELSTPGKWSSVRSVSAARTYFHKTPDARTKEKTFVVKHDAVRILKAQHGWVEAEFGTDKVVRGWLKESDLLPPGPK